MCILFLYFSENGPRLRKLVKLPYNVIFLKGVEPFKKV